MTAKLVLNAEAPALPHATDSCQKGLLPSTAWRPARIVTAKCAWHPAAWTHLLWLSGRRRSTAFDIPPMQPSGAKSVASNLAGFITSAATWNGAQAATVSSSCALADRRPSLDQLWLGASFSQGRATPSGPTSTAYSSESKRRRAARAVAASPMAHQAGLCGGSPARSTAPSKISR